MVSLPFLDHKMNPKMTDFTHLDAKGNPSMVDVGSKVPSSRKAVARSIVLVNDDILNQFNEKDIQTKKGPVFQTAIIAGVMAAKKTGDLIPLCHPIGLENCHIEIKITQNKEIEIICTVSVFAKTGIEMEALTGASVAALTIYDMCKAFSHEIVIKETRLIHKSGGKSNFDYTL
jgi:cyclic pyranopterin monophosphate synthase